MAIERHHVIIDTSAELRRREIQDKIQDATKPGQTGLVGRDDITITGRDEPFRG